MASEVVLSPKLIRAIDRVATADQQLRYIERMYNSALSRIDSISNLPPLARQANKIMTELAYLVAVAKTALQEEVERLETEIKTWAVIPQGEWNLLAISEEDSDLIQEVCLEIECKGSVINTHILGILYSIRL